MPISWYLYGTHDLCHMTIFLFSPWESSAPVTVTTTEPDDFTFALGDNSNDHAGGVTPSLMNQGNPFNLSDLSSTLPPSFMPENTASGTNEVGVLYIETLNLFAHY